jgi:hypothetical protein
MSIRSALGATADPVSKIGSRRLTLWAAWDRETTPWLQPAQAARGAASNWTAKSSATPAPVCTIRLVEPDLVM